MPETKGDLEQRCINTIRFLAIDAIQAANSGHPGAPMALAPLAYVLWTQALNYNPQSPQWLDRDRFILSAGHASMLLYAVLHLTGYDLSLEQIKAFRQWRSQTPGHPERGAAPGVETTTGPLGQGFANGVGMAIAQRYLAARFNRPGHHIIDHHIYAICSDGDVMEGIASEAASLAGHLGLGDLVYFYDDNRITIEGETKLTFSEEVAKRFEAYGWHVQRIADGNDIRAIADAIPKAKKTRTQPSLIIVRTHIAYGSPNKQDTAGAHGAPLGEEEVELTKKNLGWPLEPKFHIPEDVVEYFRKAVDRGKKLEDEWRRRVATYEKAHPDLAAEWRRVMNRDLPAGWADGIPAFNPGDKPIATRAASGKALNALAEKLPELIGGSADLAPSNNTQIKSSGDFEKGAYGNRNLRFGVREHAMGGILSGIALYGGLRPYGGTFLVFSDYQRPSVRLAAMMRLPTIYIYTHDSIGLGEDGPTHQPIEHIASLRAIPSLCVIRPADANEAAEGWKAAIEWKEGPVAFLLTRQGVPIIDRRGLAEAQLLRRGAYVLAEAKGKLQGILIASGSEVHPALEAWEKLNAKGCGVRLVSMPCWEFFERQDEAYRESVFPKSVTARLAVEAAVPLGWERYVGSVGSVIGIERFGASAPYKTLMTNYGFNVDNIVRRMQKLF